MYLGIDLGTSALKVILIDDDQKLLGKKTSLLRSTVLIHYFRNNLLKNGETT